MFMLALSVTGQYVRLLVKADEWNLETAITINQPTEAEGTVLRVGSYVLMLIDLPATVPRFAFLKGVEHHIIATVFANPNSPN